ncbi:hypothetical protein F0562_010670 [Nyssa sinensis]|uniref:Uncharacterized protein n=1 Tax=Nyssa sinensis TaxID=561372 RepID=A0A5J5A4N1_9ASTE|nr:hypothetical protein F0562_010670 [Nyssa sinensis]
MGVMAGRGLEGRCGLGGDREDGGSDGGGVWGRRRWRDGDGGGGCGVGSGGAMGSVMVMMFWWWWQRRGRRWCWLEIWAAEMEMTVRGDDRREREMGGAV